MSDEVIGYKEELKEILSIMDIEGLLEILNGNIEVVKKFMWNFYETFESISVEVETYISLGEYEEARKLVHKVKGASGNLRFTQVYIESCNLEDVLKKGEKNIIDNNFERFNMSMKTILCFIKENRIS